MNINKAAELNPKDKPVPKELPLTSGFVETFAKVAGCTVEELRGYIGPEIVGCMEMDYPDIVQNLFPGGKVDTDTAKLMQNRWKVEQETKDPDFARYIFWKGFIDYKLEKDLVYKDSHPEARKALSMETSGLFGFIDNAYDQRAVWKMPTQEDALQKSNEDLLPGETLKSREEFINGQLEKAMQIAETIRKGGSVPAFRWLFFSDKDKQSLLISETEASDVLTAKNDVPMGQSTLEQVANHTDSPDERDLHPLDSWTLMPPSGWIYKSMLLGFANPVLLVSLVKPSEIGFARREFPSTWTEETTFYLENSGNRIELDSKTPLPELRDKGIKGFFMPNEWEFTVFEPMPKVAVVVFKP